MLLQKLQELASQKGRLKRQMVSASPSQKIILQIQLETIQEMLTQESRSLRRKEWRVC